MDENAALAGFSAIAHQVRLRTVRMLIVAGADGMAAGAMATELDDAPPSRISFHLKELDHAGLVISRREGKSIVYSADFPALSDLVAFLMHDCCEGHCAYCDKPAGRLLVLAACKGSRAH